MLRVSHLDISNIFKKSSYGVPIQFLEDEKLLFFRETPEQRTRKIIVVVETGPLRYVTDDNYLVEKVFKDIYTESHVFKLSDLFQVAIDFAELHTSKTMNYSDIRIVGEGELVKLMIIIPENKVEELPSDMDMIRGILSAIPRLNERKTVDLYKFIQKLEKE